VTTFALPDLRGRIGVDDGTGAGLSPVVLGEVFGSESTALTFSQLPAHDHDYTPVPEPTTLGLLMVCVGGIIIRPGRRANAQAPKGR